MSKLTYNLLKNFPYSRYADAQSIQRGRYYYQTGRVLSVELYSEREALCDVSGNSGEYTVTIELDARSDRLDFTCDCPYGQSHFCKHMVAAGLELTEYLEAQADYEEDEEDEGGDQDEDLEPAPKITRAWQNRLNALIDQFPRGASSGGNYQRYAGLLLLERSEYYYNQSYQFTPYVIKARDWNILGEMTAVDRETVNNLLEQNTEWIKYGEELYGKITPEGCLNLTPEAMNLLVLLNQFVHYFGGSSSNAISCLPLLKQLGVPLFLANRTRRTVRGRITLLPQPAKLQVFFSRSKGNLLLKAGLEGETRPLGEGKAEIISNNPTWILLDNTLFRLADSRHLPLLSSFPLSVPESQADVFRENYLQHIVNAFPVSGDVLTWREVDTAPVVPRLYLQDDKNSQLRAVLRFGYGDYETSATKSGEVETVEPIPGTWELARIRRQIERERDFYQMLTGPVYRLKRADSSEPYGTFELRARAHPFDFLMYSIPKLTAAGFEIYGEENLKAGRVNRSTPTLRVNITSGIDWFDLHATVQFGELEVDFQSVRKALKRGERYIKLADGSIGQLPEEWLEKYRHLWNLAHETEDGFRVSDFHLPLIDTLLEDGTANQPPPDLAQRRERLRGFAQIASQPLPQGFVGELRPYQKHGFDWLHFLREYRFGGILADDMGLGKTVQMLAYLLSLKERSTEAAHPVSLLVVPKTLIANWQREAENFTPGLHFLEYLGNFRSKDTAQFNDYDVILTTYGTMLRDVDLLSKYPFDHVILDESQAIKNPLAKSAKAARLLNAAHRLVMTGTPVENNTFELWSQFAFVNPGLLGNLDYFKSSFANPIESEGDEQAAATLRKLIYPFILRRTKEQVAPELPPRTERTIYADMDTAQKKVYQQTRERYRAELLGMIDRQGLNDTRFKILEGLLRLRQIAIHPALVEPAYRGEAPKFDILLGTLENLQGEKHKALIFSQFVETLRMVRRELDARKMRYEYLDGQTRDRQARVDSFQNDPSIPFFLISLKAGGVGLNLTAADYVIHLDPWWNPAVEMQASDRAHRIGQDKPVFVYKIITRGTVEEKILQLQEKKRDLVKNLIATEASFFKSLTRDDVKMLFE